MLLPGSSCGKHNSFTFEANMQADYYNTIQKTSIAEYKDKGSKFIAYAFHIATANEFKDKLAAIKKEHPKASHHCFAYRLGTDGNLFRVSDDGEPSGTAGKPILGQIDSKQITNILIIVVRYFGGTLLGVPGLIHAYKTTASMALQLTPIIHMPVLIHYRVQFDYTKMNEVMRIIKQFNCSVSKQEAQLFCIMEIAVPRIKMNEVLFKLREIKGIEIIAI